ncbi:hypothetical protein E2562_008813 [Oryza meyeriana var. granulata]|uniref:Uncharacterized protein n=1 Tax=Oryza meyeriana var. granulata TaxID=110450 RepID=A0A6G1D047_9ORYZ|nr:hypothetical protein E2562_008813 [Oryza meyeriana var. granulata]
MPSRACDHAMRRRCSPCCSCRNHKSLWRTRNQNGKTKASSDFISDLQKYRAAPGDTLTFRQREQKD